MKDSIFRYCWSVCRQLGEAWEMKFDVDSDGRGEIGREKYRKAASCGCRGRSGEVHPVPNNLERLMFLELYQLIRPM